MNPFELLHAIAFCSHQSTEQVAVIEHDGRVRVTSWCISCGALYEGNNAPWRLPLYADELAKLKRDPA